MELIEVTSYSIFHAEFFGVCGKGVFFDDERGRIRIELAEGRDAGTIEARLIVEIGDRRFSPGNVCVVFGFILYGRGS